MIRIVVAEDSPTMLELLVEMLRGDREIEVVGTAMNGLDAVAQTKALRPDVVTMDIQMPLLDGLEATALIMVEAPTPIVIISSTIDPHNVTTTLQALQAGALTALPKPPGPGTPGFADAARALVETVKAMSQVKVVRRWPEPIPRRPKRRSSGKHAPFAPSRLNTPEAAASLPLDLVAARCPVVAIAASTGGPAALHRILSDLPPTFPAPILVVQHISPGFIDGVAEWLDCASELRVKVAEHDERLVPGTAYLAPDGSHLAARTPGHIALSSQGPVGGFRPSADILFESVASTFGASVLAVVLTGMGRDGTVGLNAVHEKRGRIIAQDEASSAVFGMPASAIASGFVNSIVSLSDMASVLVQVTRRKKESDA